jgi:hypothetical protein
VNLSPRAAEVIVLVVLGFAPGRAAAEEGVDRGARIVAQALSEAILVGDEAAAAVLFALPANLDGRPVSSAEELRRRWVEVLARTEVRRLTSEGIEVISMTEARERYGPPPARLGELTEDDLAVAIIRFDRAQIVAVLARREGRWAIIALTD